jgi:hypothetical protein
MAQLGRSVLEMLEDYCHHLRQSHLQCIAETAVPFIDLA